jgi:hypothetical protein
MQAVRARRAAAPARAATRPCSGRRRRAACAAGQPASRGWRAPRGAPQLPAHASVTTQQRSARGGGRARLAPSAMPRHGMSASNQSRRGRVALSRLWPPLGGARRRRGWPRRRRWRRGALGPRRGAAPSWPLGLMPRAVGRCWPSTHARRTRGAPRTAATRRVLAAAAPARRVRRSRQKARAPHKQLARSPRSRRRHRCRASTTRWCARCAAPWRNSCWAAAQPHPARWPPQRCCHWPARWCRRCCPRWTAWRRRRRWSSCWAWWWR